MASSSRDPARSRGSAYNIRQPSKRLQRTEGFNMGIRLPVPTPVPSWKTAPPPPELLHAPPRISDGIEGILEGSVDYVQAILAFEVFREQERLDAEREREEQGLTPTEISLLRLYKALTPEEFHLVRQSVTVGELKIPVVEPSDNVSGPANNSKGKERSIQENQESTANMDFPGSSSRNIVSSHSSGQSGSFESLPRAQGYTSSAATSSTAITSPPADVKDPSTAEEGPTVVTQRTDAKDPFTAEESPTLDLQRASARKWILRFIRPYVTAFIKSRGRSSQGKLSKGTLGSTSTSKECVSCLEDFGVKEMVHLVCHDYCSPCFTLLIETSISTETSWPPKCCLNEVPKEIITSNIHSKLKTRYMSMVEERSIAIEDRVYCSKTSCGSWIPLHRMDKSLFLARCTRCPHKTCMVCRGSYHTNGECPDDPNLRETLRCAMNAGWRRCFKCNALVEHDEGCSHMTCRCKAQFCYTCGRKWKTCRCTEDELEVHLTAAQWRRERQAASQTQDRQAAYAALEGEIDADQTEFSDELQEILDQLEFEEFEGGNPVERTAEERWTLALAIQRETEINRVRDFEDTLQRLNEELDFVHSIQQIANLNRFEVENKLLADATKEELAHIDKVFNIFPQEDKGHERAKYIAAFKRWGIEPPDEIIHGTFDAKAWSHAWGRHLASTSSDDNCRKDGEEVPEFVKWFDLYGVDATNPMVNLALGGPETSTARAQQLEQERKHNQQKDKINARLEAEQERLRVGHQWDKKWIEEVTRVREAMVVNMAFEEFPF